MAATTPVKGEGEYLDMEAEELDDLLSALSRTPEVHIRSRGEAAGAGPRGFATPKTEGRGVRPSSSSSSVAISSAEKLDRWASSQGARGGTRSAGVTPAQRKARERIESIQAKFRSRDSVEDLLSSSDKADLVSVAGDLIDYIVGRSKIFKQEKLLHSFQRTYCQPAGKE